MRAALAVLAAVAGIALMAGCEYEPHPPRPSASVAPAIPPATATPTAPPSTPLPPQPPADPCHQGAIAYCVLNQTVTQGTIGQTICVRGWTSTIRPPVSYTEALKRQQIASEHLPGSISAYEEDHRMPLELGGAPSDPTNLSPESPRSPNPKDSDESALREQVCFGRLTLAAAQAALVAKWLAPYPGYKA